MERPNKMRHFKKAVLVVAALIVLMALLVFGYFVFLSNSSTKGTVSGPKAEPAPTERRSARLEVRGKYISLKYPGTYATQNTNFNQNTSYVLEQYNFIADTVYDKRMAIVVQKNPEGLNENSSVKMRKIYSDKYKERSVTIPASKAYIFTNVETGEQGLFVQKGDLMTSIVVVAQGQENLEKEINDIAASFRWLN